MSERKLRIGVAGATGAVGREIITLLEQAPLPPGSIVPMASPACKVHSIETGGRSIRVENLLVDLELHWIPRLSAQFRTVLEHEEIPSLLFPHGTRHRVSRQQF